MTSTRPILLVTLGTSLLGQIDNSAQKSSFHAELSAARRNQDWTACASLLRQLDPADRGCGAEINSVHELITQGVTSATRIVLLHSATEAGEAVAAILREYFTAPDHEVETRRIEGLQDDDPQRFRNQGLRNLAAAMGRTLRDFGPAHCVIDATGGYKAQIAVAVVLGQALGVPVYYKHERFALIISVPPMPVSLDFDLWLDHQDLFADLRDGEMIPASRAGDDGPLPERLRTLLEIETVDGVDYVTLNYMGEIFDQTFRLRRPRAASLPPAVPPARKQPPSLTEHNYDGLRPALERFLQKVTAVPYVLQCSGHYNNPDLPHRNSFRLHLGRVEGIFSNGTGCVKFWVDTLATSPDQRQQAVLDLNRRLAEGYLA